MVFPVAETVVAEAGAIGFVTPGACLLAGAGVFGTAATGLLAGALCFLTADFGLLGAGVCVAAGLTFVSDWPEESAATRGIPHLETF